MIKNIKEVNKIRILNKLKILYIKNRLIKIALKSNQVFHDYYDGSTIINFILKKGYLIWFWSYTIEKHV